MPTLDMYLVWTAEAILGLVVGLSIPILYRLRKISIHKSIKVWMLVTVGMLVYFSALFGLHQFNTGLLIFLIVAQMFVAYTLYRANIYIRKLQAEEAL